MNCYLCKRTVITEDKDGYGFLSPQMLFFHSECLECMGLEIEPETDTPKAKKIIVKGEEDA